MVDVQQLAVEMARAQGAVQMLERVFVSERQRGGQNGGGKKPNECTLSVIEDRSIPEPMSGCWLWLGAYRSKKYGIIALRGKVVGAHRFSWQADRGVEPPPDRFICHRCDNPACVNPDHLFLGTRQENVDDMMRKGRHVAPSGERNGARRHPERFAEARAAHRGEGSGTAKLTAAQVMEIRRRFKAGESRTQLAKAFAHTGVTYDAIKQLIRRATWAHIPEESAA